MPLPSERPKVSVLMMAYNHAPFVAQAIDSALSQETTFNFEIVIGEDCSTDGTRQIVHDFQRKHPEKIRLLLSDRNLGMHDNYFQTLRACSGEYLAILEGDDFWTSHHKLQRQADFLDSHPDYSICFHNVTAFREGVKNSSWFHCPANQKKTSTVEDLLAGSFIPSCSAMSRNGLVNELPDWASDLKMLDWPLHILRAQHGYIGYLNETMAAYRVHSGGAYSSLNMIERQLSRLEVYEALPAGLSSRSEKLIRRHIFRTWYALAVGYAKDNDHANADKYRNLCLSEGPFSNHFTKKVKLLLRFNAPRLFRIVQEIKSLSQIPKRRAKIRRNKHAVIAESNRA